MRSIRDIFKKVKQDMDNTDVLIQNTHKLAAEKRKEEENKMKKEWAKKYQLDENQIQFKNEAHAIAPTKLSGPDDIFRACKVPSTFKFDESDVLKFERNTYSMKQNFFREVGLRMQEDIDHGIRWMTWSLDHTNEEMNLSLYTEPTKSWSVDDSLEIVVHGDYDVGPLLRASAAEYDYFCQKRAEMEQFCTKFEYIYYHVAALACSLSNTSSIDKLNLIDENERKIITSWSSKFVISDYMKKVLSDYMPTFDESAHKVHMYLPVTRKFKWDGCYLYDGNYERKDDTSKEEYHIISSIQRFFEAVEHYDDDPDNYNDYMYDVGLGEVVDPKIQMFYKTRNRHQDNDHFWFFGEMTSIHSIFKILSHEKQYLKGYQISGLFRTGPRRARHVTQVPFKYKDHFYLYKEQTTPIIVVKNKTNYNTDGLRKVKVHLVKEDKRKIPKEMKNWRLSWNTYYKFELFEKYVMLKQAWMPRENVLRVEKSRLLKQKRECEARGSDGATELKQCQRHLDAITREMKENGRDPVKKRVSVMTQPRVKSVISSSSSDEINCWKRKGKKPHYRDKMVGFWDLNQYAWDDDPSSSEEM